MADLTGKNIGRYHVIEQLGQGGMAVVYKAFDTTLERDVAIKFIRTGVIGPDHLKQMLKRFEREAKSLARMDHPNIVSVFDYGEHEGSPYLVMQYLPGGTLKHTPKKPMPFDKAARLLLPIARALEFAHGLNVVHRDVKPANILITQSGEPMLSDFGIAKILGESGMTQLTGTGMGVGTPDYMAPEQWKGEVEPATDIYALGVVFYELVTGSRPYTADTPAAVFEMMMMEPLPRPTEFVPDLPDEVEKVLFKALAKKPEERYESTGAFAGVLEKMALGGMGLVQIPTDDIDTESPTVDTIKPPVVEKRGIPTWLAAGLGALAVIIVVGIVLVSGVFGDKEQTSSSPTSAVTVVEVAEGVGTNTAPIKTETLILTATQDSTPTATQTTTHTPTLNHTPTSSPTQIPIPGEVIIPIGQMAQTIPWLAYDEEAIPGIEYYGFNVDAPPFDDVLVRQAFALAVDREAIVDVARNYSGNPDSLLPATTFTHPEALGRNLYGEVGLSFDPVRAKQLLTEAGYSDPADFPEVTLIVNSTRDGRHVQNANAVTEMWETYLGVEINVEEIAWSDYLERLKDNNPPAIFRMGWAADYIDPNNFLNDVLGSGSESNRGNFLNSDYTELLNSAAAPSLFPEERQVLYIQAEYILCEEQAGVIPLFHYISIP